MRTILITGTSSGIGKETAILFAKKGWNVIATMRKREEFTQFSDYSNIQTHYLDVRDRDSIEKCIEKAIQKFGKVDVIVNNAGIYTTNPLEETPGDCMDAIIDTNIKGVLYTTQAILKHFREQKSGMIVNVSSVAGRVTFPFQSVYHTSKWAIEGLSESLSYELNPLNIKVKVVEPGMVKTNIYNMVWEIPFDSYPEGYKESFKRWHSSLTQNYNKGYLPELDARTIYKAVNSKSNKLRYTSDTSTRMVLLLRKIFGLRIFQYIAGKQTIG